MPTEISTLQLAIETSLARRGAREFERAGEQVIRSSDKMDKRLTLAENRIKKLGRTSSSTASILGRLGAGLSATFLARGALGVITGYENATAKLQGVLEITDRTDAAFVSLLERSRELGATTRFTATQAAEAMVNLARAGFQTDEIFQSVTSTLDLALAGELSLSEASKLAAQSLRTFGLAASDTERVVDVLVKTSNKTNTTVGELGNAMRFAGPIAAALGKSYEETASALGVLADSGLAATLGGTNLRGVLTQLIKPSDSAADTINNLRLTLGDLNPETASLAEIFERLAEKQLSAGEAAKIAQQRAASGLTILTRNVDKLKELEEQNDLAAGTARKFGQVVDDTLTGSILFLTSSIQELAIQLFSPRESSFGAAMQKSIDVTTGAVRILVGMEETVTENRKASILLAGGIKAVALAGSVFIALKLGAVVSSLAVALVGLPATLLRITASMAPLLAGVAALGVALVSIEVGRYFFEEFRGVQEGLAKFLNFFEKGWLELKFGFKNLVNDMGGFWDGFISGLESAYRRFLDAVAVGATALGEEKLAARIYDSIADAETASLKRRTESIAELERFVERNVLQNLQVRDIAEETDAFKILDNLTRAGLGASTRQAQQVTEQMDVILETLIDSGDSNLTQLAEFISGRRDEIISQIGDLGTESNRELLDRQRAAAFQFASDSLSSRLAEIATEFGGKERKGKSFSDFIAADINIVKEKFTSFTDDIAASLEAAFVGAKMPAETAAETTGEVADAMSDLQRELDAINALDPAAAPERANAAYEDWLTSLNEAITDLKREKALLTDTSAAQFILNEAKLRGVALSKEEAATLTGRLEYLEGLQEELEAAEKLNNVYRDTGSIIGGFVGDLVTKTDTLADAARNAALALQDLFVQAFVVQPIADGAFDLLKNLSGAAAGAAGGETPRALGGLDFTGIVAQARGGLGLVTKPTFTPLMNGGLRKTGEAGAEYTMPAVKLSDGTMGVRAKLDDADRGGGGNVFHINMNGITDGASVRKSVPQVVRELKNFSARK